MICHKTQPTNQHLFISRARPGRTKLSNVFHIAFHFILDLHLLHISPNCLTISFSHCGGGLQVSSIPLDNSTGPPIVYESSTCLAQWNFYSHYSTITSFTQLCSWITLFWICSHNDIPTGMDLSIALCDVTSLCSLWLPTFCMCLPSQAKWCYWRDWHVGSCPVLPWAHLLSPRSYSLQDLRIHMFHCLSKVDILFLLDFTSFSLLYEMCIYLFLYDLA